jgi:ATP-dependent Clp protease ATP-binding subunit ClpC
MLLQIMEEGCLTDSFGRRVDFKNVILILTSNIGAGIIKNQTGLGFVKASDQKNYERMKSNLMVEVEKYFRPEFLNRLDEVIVFEPLTEAHMKQILDIQLKDLRERLSAKQMALELSPEAEKFVIESGTNLDYGARPLRRSVERLIEDPLSEEILKGNFEDGAKIMVTVADGKLHFAGQGKEEPVATT